MKIVQCGQEQAGAIRAILNDAIANSTAIYDYAPRTAAMMDSWLEAKAKASFPVVGLEGDDRELLGFASYGSFRSWAAYKYSVEHSVYVDKRFRGRGLGAVLLREVVAAATAQGYHMVIGGIDADNAASIALHRRLGFSHCASIKQAGFKFGRWLDLEFYQRILATPAHPVDG
jgi:L-amino acid N-acyltransferase